MKVWSTEGVPLEQRLAYWGQAAAAALVDMDVGSREASGFGGQLRRLCVDGLAFIQFAAGPHAAYRTPRAIAADKTHPFLLIAQGAQPWSVRQAGRLLHLRPGDVVLVDTAHPFELHFPQACAGLAISMPRAWTGGWLRDLDSAGARVAWREQGWGRTLSALCLQLAEDPQQALAYPEGKLGAHVGALVAAALAPRDPVEQPSAPTVAQRALLVMAKHLHRPGYTAGELAEQMDLSLRSLHRAFSAQGLTIAGALRDLRLKHAAQLLERRELAGLSIAEVGSRCGYADPSHFAREFRRAWNVSPAQWRRNASAPAEIHPIVTRPAIPLRSGRPRAMDLSPDTASPHG